MCYMSLSALAAVKTNLHKYQFSPEQQAASYVQAFIGLQQQELVTTADESLLESEGKKGKQDELLKG